jgi:hypothetical protein
MFDRIKRKTFFNNLKVGSIVALDAGACVQILDASTFGLDVFVKEESYVLITECIRFGNGYDRIVGYFVEPNMFGCLKNEKVKVVVYPDSIDTERGPYEENDMVPAPLVGIFGPMTKKERSEYYKANKEWLEFNGIYVSEQEENT